MAVSAHGTIIKRNGASIQHLQHITLPRLAREVFDVTRRGDVDDRYKVGIRNLGDLTFDANLVQLDSTIAGLITAWKNATKDDYEIDFTDGAVWLFSGYVSRVEPRAPVDGPLSVGFTIRPSTAVSFPLDGLLLEDGGLLLQENGDGLEL